MRNAETVLAIIRDRGRRGLPLEDVYRQLYNPDLLKVDRMSEVLTLPAAMGAVQLSVADGSPFGLLAGQSDAGGLCPTPTPTLA
jgi:hypothetical protein